MILNGLMLEMLIIEKNEALRSLGDLIFKSSKNQVTIEPESH
jgi:hypothetical protein